MKKKEKIYKFVITWDDVEEYNKKYFEEHPRAKNKRIEKPFHPSLNEVFQLSRFARRDLKARWGQFIVWLVEKHGLTDLGIDKCTIHAISYFGDEKTHDDDNYSPKFILDGFVNSGLLNADDYLHVNPIILEGKYDADNPRTEFIFLLQD